MIEISNVCSNWYFAACLALKLGLYRLFIDDWLPAIAGKLHCLNCYTYFLVVLAAAKYWAVACRIDSVFKKCKPGKKLMGRKD
jgi:hypothetical protein